MTKSNVIYDEEDLELLDSIKSLMLHNSDMEFYYFDKRFRIEYMDKQFCAYCCEDGYVDKRYFKNFDDLMENYIVDGKPFKEIIPEIECYGLL